MDEITLNYSEKLIRETIYKYWRKQVGFTFPIVTVAMTILLLFLIIRGERSWFVGAASAIVLISIVMMVAIYFVHLRRSLARLKKMVKPEAKLKLDEDTFHLKSDIGESVMKWTMVSKLWRFEGAWLLFFSPGEFVTLPIANMSNETKQFIIDRLMKNDAEIA